jgi:hypothetical protein
VDYASQGTPQFLIPLAREVEIGLGRLALLLDESVQQNHFIAFEYKQDSCHSRRKSRSYLPNATIHMIDYRHPEGPPELNRLDVGANFPPLISRQRLQPDSNRLGARGFAVEAN